MENQTSKTKVVQFLCQPKGGKSYLLRALDSNSERLFIEALHHIIDAMSKDLIAK